MAQSGRDPKLNAILICERVIQDAGSGLVSLINIMENIRGAIPFTVPAISLYAKMTDAQGEYVFKVEVVRTRDQTIIAEVTLPPVHAPSPLGVGDLTIQLGNLRFEEAGAYEFRLKANDKFLDLKTLRIEAA